MSLTKNDLEQIQGIVRGSEERLNTKIEETREELNAKIGDTEARLNDKIEASELFLAKTTMSEIERLDAKIDGVAEGLHVVAVRLGDVEEAVEGIANGQDRLERQMRAVITNQDEMYVRLDKLERKTT